MNIVLLILAVGLCYLSLRFFILRRAHLGLQSRFLEARAQLDRMALEESVDEAKLSAILSSMVEGVLVVDKKGAILLMNPSLKKDFFVETDPVGKKPLEVIRNVALQDLVENVLGSNEPRVISQEITLVVPQERFFMVNCVPILRDSEMEGAVLVFHDISELKRLERIRQDFVANVSHELRTPLSSIKGYAETLLEGALEDRSHARDFVDIIHRDSERLSKLIDDILDLSKIESGKMKMSFGPVDLGDAIRRTLAILDNQAKAKNIAIQLNVPEGLPLVRADETRLIQVLMNLTDNAIKYTPEDGRVTLSVVAEGGFVHVDVIDTGIGIPEKDLPRIFERFYRVDKARSREMGGTGLGLSIVKHIVSAHDGQIWVASVQGQGSTFSFTIPIVTP